MRLKDFLEAVNERRKKMKKIILAIVLAVMLFVIVACDPHKEEVVEATLTIDSTELILSDYNYFEMWNETGCLGRNYTNEIDKLIVSEKMMTIYRKDGIIIVSNFTVLQFNKDVYGEEVEIE